MNPPGGNGKLSRALPEDHSGCQDAAGQSAEVVQPISIGFLIVVPLGVTVTDWRSPPCPIMSPPNRRSYCPKGISFLTIRLKLLRQRRVHNTANRTGSG